MKFISILKISLVLLATFVSGCAGDRILVATKTNVGLDIDTKPPTAEITIARRELGIQPTFPETVDNDTVGNTDLTGTAAKDATETKAVTENKDVKETALPLLASFGLQGNFLNPRITGHFAGGDAAIYLAQESANDGDSPVDSSLCLKNQPDPRGSLLKMWHAITNTSLEEYRKEPRLFYFATDTSYGLKVAWSGTSGPYPDSLKLGYNRKEFASPPIYIDERCGGDPFSWNVKLPSFYAAIDNASGWETVAHETSNNFDVWKGYPKHIQFFATGKAATAFAQRASVRQVAFENMAPNAAKNEAETLNQDLIADIEKAFAADKKAEADLKRHDAILAKAIELELVPKGTTTVEFLEKLSANSKGLNYSVSTKLNKLRTFTLGYEHFTGAVFNL